jgi:WD40 repeat protein
VRDAVFRRFRLSTAHTVCFFPFTGKDSEIKYWDCDIFEHILTLQGHTGPVWSLIVSLDGGMALTCSQDRSLRLWGRTDEPVFLEEVGGVEGVA